MWMKSKAEGCGLAFDEDYVGETFHPKALGALHNSKSGLYRFTRGHTREIGNRSATEFAHHGAVTRFKETSSDYQPRNLGKYLADPKHRVTEAQEGSGDDRQ